jgi:hypothetical protein
LQGIEDARAIAVGVGYLLDHLFHREHCGIGYQAPIDRLDPETKELSAVDH